HGPSPAVQPWLTSAACALGLWLWALSRGVRPRVRLWLPAIAIFAWAVVSQLALRPETVMLAMGLLLMGIAAGLAEDEGTTTALQAGMLGAAAISALAGIVQYLGASAVLEPWINIARPGEAFGNLRQPNLYASLCWIGAAIVLWGGLRLPLAARAVLIGLLAAGSAASVSRTGLLQALAVLALAAIWNGPSRRERMALCAVALASYFAAAVLLPLALQATADLDPARTLWVRLGGGEGCSSRLVLWSNVLRLIALKPLAGWGWGELDYAHFMTLYPGERFCDILDNAHSLPLHLAVELGLPAALAIAGIGVLAILRRMPWKEAMPRRQLAWALIAIILLHSLLEYPLWYGPFQIAFGASLGWLLASEEQQEAGVRPLARSAAVAIILLPATAYAAWDYARVSQVYLPPEQRRAAWADDTLEHVRRSWLFAGQARFADLTLASLSPSNAAWMHDLSNRMLHYSPEPRVIERAIESATMVGQEDEAVLHLARYRAAFPGDYAQWSAALRRQPAAPPGR
ncbi:MAG: O-antigen polymerase, partial [Ramlibacter sp.]|nr:O-antigen polymerase [Ramlibacter sp.]